MEYKVCSSCTGLGYTHHQLFYEDGFDLLKERDCLICKGKGIVFR